MSYSSLHIKVRMNFAIKFVFSPIYLSIVQRKYTRLFIKSTSSCGTYSQWNIFLNKYYYERPIQKYVVTKTARVNYENNQNNK